MRKKLLFLSILFLPIALLSGCLNSASETATSSGDSTGNAGIASSDVEKYFSEHISNKIFVDSTVSESGDCSVSISLSSDESERKTIYGDFAKSVIDTCNGFRNSYKTNVSLLSIFFFQDGKDHIYWQSYDGGKTGVLYEKLVTYSKERKITSDELIRSFSQVDDNSIVEQNKLYEDDLVDLYYYRLEKSIDNKSMVVFIVKNKYYETLEFQCSSLLINGKKYDDIIMSDPVQGITTHYIEAIIDDELVSISKIDTISVEMHYFDKLVSGKINENFSTETIKVK